MAAKRFQTRTEEEIEQLLRDKSWRSTNKATLNAVRTLRDFCKEQNLDESFQELGKTDLNSLLRKFRRWLTLFQELFGGNTLWNCQVLATGKEVKNYRR